MSAEPSVTALDADYCRALLPRRDPSGHKGSFGTVVCVAGSLEYAGAGLLCASSAVRGGAGLVALAVPDWLAPSFAGRVPEVVTVPLRGNAEADDLDLEGALDLIDARRPTALVVGPGLIETEGYRLLLQGLLAVRGAPMVIDGGGLNMLARSSGWSQSVQRSCVMTPHPGEFARLTGVEGTPSDEQRLERCLDAAHRFGQVVVLKGAHTVIAAPDGRVARSPFAIAALATAGSGDVLAGLIGALLAQGVPAFDAACLGVYLHGRAGERLSWRLGDAGIAASDLPYEIALARHELSAHAG
jgi:hydroxyethylthiazole kinase-like uncharacterized protein yjeF